MGKPTGCGPVDLGSNPNDHPNFGFVVLTVAQQAFNLLSEGSNPSGPTNLSVYSVQW
jgi:hypothetical protein